MCTQTQAAGLSPPAGSGSVWTLPAPGFSPVPLRQPSRWGETFMNLNIISHVVQLLLFIYKEC